MKGGRLASNVMKHAKTPVLSQKALAARNAAEATQLEANLVENKKRRFGHAYNKGNMPSRSRKGIPNKITSSVKTMILEALLNVGGQFYLEQQAREQPVAFMALLKTVIPQQQVEIASTGPLVIRWRTHANDT